jgi:hypothetical protein
MTFTPTGAKMAHPSADDVDKAVEEATRPLTGMGDGLTFDGFWKKTRIAGNMEDFGAFPADKALGIERNDVPRYEGLESWKVAFAWVDKHVGKGPSEGVPHPYPSLFNGENLADEWVMDVFKSKRRGIFIDLGANDAVHNSNTFTLERLGWDGLCIEPMYHHLPSLTHRKCKVCSPALPFPSLPLPCLALPCLALPCLALPCLPSILSSHEPQHPQNFRVSRSLKSGHDHLCTSSSLSGRAVHRVHVHVYTNRGLKPMLPETEILMLRSCVQSPGGTGRSAQGHWRRNTVLQVPPQRALG